MGWFKVAQVVGKEVLKKIPRKFKVAPDITKVKPTISKELSESATGLKVAGWAKRMKKKLKKD